MAAEWTRNAIIALIQEYKNQKNLYDPKNSLYYNKKARIHSLKKIVEAVSQARPETTTEEIHKKIQTLRTQMGQELTKIEKSREIGDEAYLYVPKVWWYASFDWITAYMKFRNDPTTPRSAKLDSSGNSNASKIDIYNDYDESGNEATVVEYAEEEINQEPEAKRRKTYSRQLNKQASKFIKDDDIEQQTFQYVIQEEPDNITNDQQIIEIQSEPAPAKEDINRYKKRAKSFGKYIASLMLDIRDDYTFFETQSQILKIIEHATLKSNK